MNVRKMCNFVCLVGRFQYVLEFPVLRQCFKIWLGLVNPHPSGICTYVLQFQDLRRDSLLRDTDGKQMNALTIFTMAIQHIRKRLIQDVQRRNRHVHAGDISYVLTVPAIWSDAAKQFMREAAVNVRTSVF